ncbi:MAG: MopE-related protein, partial [Bacteroidota bacterium]
MNRKILLVWAIIFIAGWQELSAQHSVAREWNEVLLEAIRDDFARPTVHARNLWHSSVMMYDVWAVYDDTAQTFFLGKTLDGYIVPFNGISTPPDIEAAREEAISYAMYRLIRHRFLTSPGAFFTLMATDNLMNTLGYSTTFTDTDYSSGSPAALGNYIAQQMIAFGLQDGSNEVIQYNNVFYQPVNPSLVMDLPGNPDILDMNRWQPLTLDVFIDQSGQVIPINTPPFLSPEWGIVSPFALSDDDLTIYQRDGDDYWVFCDPGSPPLIDTIAGAGDSDFYKWGFSLVSVWSSHLDATDGVMWDISPASIGNIDSDEFPETLSEYQSFYNLIEGGDASVGHAVNPHTGLPYAPQMVPRADYARVLAEFWADGPDSETPPGHWFTILNYVNDHPLFEKKYRGDGVILNDLEWDVKAYFLMGGAMHDAAIAAWGAKGYYDYIRPVSAIRAMAERGQCTDMSHPTYHPAGIPLIEGKIAIVEPGEILAEPNDENAGKIKLLAWKGPDYIIDPMLDEAGVDWILAEDWWPYQRPTFVTPPFAGYVSGHSTYSRAAAEVMTLLTGDAFFPGGVGEFQADMDDFLVFEDGPSVSITLQWATYRDASDQCSLSRIWGGIHPPADDIPGRKMGEKIGVDAFNYAETFFFRDEDEDGWFDYLDCNDNDATISPGAVELCNGIDNNCNGLFDDGVPTITYYRDFDNDGFGSMVVSIDTCILIPPTGYVWLANDCDDNNNMINPAASEFCDGIDNNCNDLIDDGLALNTYFLDSDNDGFGSMVASIDTCLLTPPAGYVWAGTDCDDNNNMINPAAGEFCDGIDNNCNNMIDEGLIVNTYYLDVDSDGFGTSFNPIDTCLLTPPEGYVWLGNDCNDFNNMIYPGASELCDGMDNNCNGMTDEGLPFNTYYLDTDNDGYGDAAFPISSCEVTPPPGYWFNDLDCDDSNEMINPGLSEICDGLDNDCSGVPDDNLPTNIFYLDSDGDGFGSEIILIDTCAVFPPDGYVGNNDDCNDENGDINPDAIEIVDGEDNDCNGLTDDVVSTEELNSVF